MYTMDVKTTIDSELLEQFAGVQTIKETPDMAYKYVAQAAEEMGERPVVIGFGPCGIFAGLILAQMGYRPIILDRGKEVRQRTKDTFGFWRGKGLNTESNVQFGEGGAGTFSDELCKLPRAVVVNVAWTDPFVAGKIPAQFKEEIRVFQKTFVMNKVPSRWGPNRPQRLH